MAPPGRAASTPAFPVLTTAVATVTAAVSTAGLVAEPVLLALRRDAAALSDGQLWRLLTALLVQDGGVPGTVFNLLGLVLVGVAAERRLGARAWLAAYLTGGLTGEFVGWQGGSRSVAATRSGCAAWPARSPSPCCAPPAHPAGWRRSPRRPGRLL
jgi:membrane associated rhomboid family serine protease